MTSVEDNGFQFKFNQDIDGAYKITYQTKASGRVFENGTVTNEVTYGSITKEGTRGIQQQILRKLNSNTNYKDKTTKWTIHFNEDSYVMKEVSLEEVFCLSKG